MLKRRGVGLAFVAAVFMALSAIASAQNYPPAVSQLVAAAKKEVRTIGMVELKAALDRGDAGLIVDVREPEEYAAGHLTGAVNVPRGLIEFTIWTHVGYPDKTDMNTKLTLYCKTGGRCALAAKSLKELGFTNVTAADMKIDEWAKAGYPLVKG